MVVTRLQMRSKIMKRKPDKTGRKKKTTKERKKKVKKAIKQRV